MVKNRRHGISPSLEDSLMKNRAIAVLLFVIVTVTGCCIFGCATTSQKDECKPIIITQYTTGEAQALDRAVDKFVADDLERRGVTTAGQSTSQSSEEFISNWEKATCGYGSMAPCDLYAYQFSHENYYCAAMVARDYKLGYVHPGYCAKGVGENTMGHMINTAATYGYGWYMSSFCLEHFGYDQSQWGGNNRCTQMANEIKKEFGLTRNPMGAPL